MFIIMTFVIGDGLQDSFLSPSVLIGVVIWSLGGLGFGAGLWHINEKRYTKALKNQ